MTHIRPGTFVVLSAEGSKKEIEYSPKTTRYVDKEENPVPVSQVSEGLPVKVFYTQTGSRVLASKVVVSKVRTSTTETVNSGGGLAPSSTSTVGVVSEIGPDTFMLRAGPASDPYSYSLSKTTTYVDETGAPVSMEEVKSGSPVTVYHTQLNGKTVVSKVMVNSKTKTTAPAIEAEQKSTTTTTTNK